MEPTNGLRDALERGERVFGARANSFSPALIEVYGDVGLDFVWLDLEHAGPSPADAATLEHLVRAAEVAGVDLLVRVPSSDAPTVGKVLDTGVRNVIVPRVETAAEVRQAVRAGHFSYDDGVGERGLAHARASGWGASVDTAGEDETVCVGAMLETRAAVENVEEILAVPGLGFTYFGPGDLARTFGRPGESDHPEVQDALDAAREACLDAGVPAGISATSLDGAERAVAEGHRLVRIGDELSAVRQLLGDRLDALDAAP